MFYLHNPSSHAHIDDLQERLSNCLMFAPFYPHDDSAEHALIRKLASVVKRMDDGQLRSRDVEVVFASYTIPNFSFRRWLSEMVEEGVYLPASQNAA